MTDNTLPKKRSNKEKNLIKKELLFTNEIGYRLVNKYFKDRFLRG